MPEQPSAPTERPRESNPRIHPDLYNNGTKEGQCPECGLDLKTVDQRQHAEQHYGELEMPKAHNNLLARQRRALLEGEKLPEY